MNTEDFVAACKIKHGDFYDYSSSQYIGSLSKISIRCPRHGIFHQVASAHKGGSGCRKCFGEANSKNKSSDIDEFIVKARRVWGDRYDYSKVDYKHCEKKITIICPEHGEFIKTPSNHLVRFGGCSACHKITMNKHYLDKFISRASGIHNNKYTYDNSEYRGNRERITITCPSHGDFEMVCGSHIAGRGCAECRKEKPTQGIFMFSEWGDEYIEKHMIEYGDIPSRCYLLSFILDEKHCYKVGITTRTTSERIVDLKKKSRRLGFPLNHMKVCGEVELTHRAAYSMEQAVLVELRTLGENVAIKIKGHTETFKIPESPEVLSIFSHHTPLDLN